MTPRVVATEATKELLDELKSENGPLMFHQSGGCCDGSQPMCFAENEFKVGSSDVCLGQVYGVPFWMSEDQFEYCKHTQLTVDVTNGRGSSFSLEIPKGKRFIIKSRMYTPEEENDLVELTRVED
ncbi:DUF779 domain-containing protein [Halocola ammonii]